MADFLVNVLGFKFTDKWWSSGIDERRELIGKIRELSDSFAKDDDVRKSKLYSSLRYNVDIISWIISSTPNHLTELRASIERILGDRARLVYGFLSIYEPTNESRHSEEGTSSEYFIAYPMSKSNDWYQLPKEKRDSIMSEHIKVASTSKDNRGVKSYTTRSFGIDDNEFVVIYEVPSLIDWMHVTQTLREVEARKWVVEDRPILVGMSNGFDAFLK